MSLPKTHITIAGLLLPLFQPCFAMPNGPRVMGLGRRDDVPSVFTGLTFTNVDGNDISHLVNVTHGTLARPRSLTKRTGISARAINDCNAVGDRSGHPLTWPNFKGSICTRETPQEIQVTCARRDNEATLPDLLTTIMLHCHEDEICADGIEYKDELTAFCASGNFLRFVEEHTAYGQAKDGVKLDDPTLPSAVQVVLTGSNISDPIKVKNLSIDALTDSGSINKLPSHGSQPWGHNECTQCSSVGLQTLPPGTQKLQANVEFNTGFTGANIFWAAVLFGSE